MGTLTQAVVTFSEPVSGVDATDLLVNGTAATSVTGRADRNCRTAARKVGLSSASSTRIIMQSTVGQDRQMAYQADT